MILSDTIIITVLVGAGTLIATLAKISYNNLNAQVILLRQEVETLRLEVVTLEKRNGELSFHNEALKHDLAEATYCPVENCHFRKVRALKQG